MKKQDVDTGDFLPQEMQNWTVLFTGCMRKKISRNQMELEFYTKAGSLIQEKPLEERRNRIWECTLEQMYVKEIAAQKDTLLDETEYDATLIYEGQEKPIVVKALTVKEKLRNRRFKSLRFQRMEIRRRQI